MKKSELVALICKENALTMSDAEGIVDLVFSSFADALKRGERIEIRGFGSFEVRDYKAYSGRNPKTGQPINVKPKKIPFFKMGRELKKKVNSSK